MWKDRENPVMGRNLEKVVESFDVGPQYSKLMVDKSTMK